MPVVSTMPVGPSGPVGEEKGGRSRSALVRSAGLRVLLLMVCVAPTSLARERREGRMSTAIMILMPTAFAAYMKSAQRMNHAVLG